LPFNDYLLANLKLLEKFDWLIYVNIDIHHDDGVKEVFYSTDLVLHYHHIIMEEIFPL
jgi:histone deacetylase 1/2